MVGVPCMVMRGGTSKGAFFLSNDLPADPAERDALLIAVMGSPDARQIDGIGGATPLTSKVAVISRSARSDADIDYLFLQVSVDQALVSDRQNCGNLLAATAQFAVERGLIVVTGPSASVRVYMSNTNSVATSTFPVDDGLPVYAARQRSTVCPEPLPACSWTSPRSQAAHAAPCFPPDLPSIESMASR